jgi:Holliday junction DNA helicase RuvA
MRGEMAMISFIKGLVAETTAESVIIDCGGVGYELHCPLPDLTELSTKRGQEKVLYTTLIHREDRMELYGFIDRKAREGFGYLLKVNGIGPRAAIKILSFFNASDLISAIESENVDSLTRIPGIGPKLARTMIVSLQGRLPEVSSTGTAAVERDLILALTNLGFKESAIRQKIQKMAPLSGDFETEFKKLIKELS